LIEGWLAVWCRLIVMQFQAGSSARLLCRVTAAVIFYENNYLASIICRWGQ